LENRGKRKWMIRNKFSTQYNGEQTGRKKERSVGKWMWKVVGGGEKGK
jgi:hypothetical protein